MQNEGGFLGLYRGFNSTVIREVPGNMIMFGIYEGLKIKFAKLQVTIFVFMLIYNQW